MQVKTLLFINIYYKLDNLLMQYKIELKILKY